MPLLALAFLFSLWSLPSPASADEVRVAAAPEAIAAYHRLLSASQPATDVPYAGTPPEGVQLLLLRQALLLGGDRRRLVPVAAPTYRRMLALVADGHADLGGAVAWANDIDADASRLQASSALAGNGAIAVGIYAVRPEIAERIRHGQWHDISAVGNRDHDADWMALQKLGLANVYDADSWPAMVRMVGAGRADFLLAPLPVGRDAAIRLDQVVLEPVPGACLPLDGSLHYVLSRSLAGNLLRERLERGLAELRRTRVLPRAWIETGLVLPEGQHCLPPG